MKTIKTLAVAALIAIGSTVASQAGSWGFAVNTGSTSIAYSSGGYTERHCSPRVAYVSHPRREFVNPYIPTVYGPREYYINGQPYMVYPQVEYVRRR